MTISIVLCLITTFKLYDMIAVLTGGGPPNSTQSDGVLPDHVAFTSNRFGYAVGDRDLLLGLTH